MNDSSRKLPSDILGYFTDWQIRAGEQLVAHLSSDQEKIARVSVRRIVCGDAASDGPGYEEQEVDSIFTSLVALKRQRTELGSYCRVTFDSPVSTEGRFSTSVDISVTRGRIRQPVVLELLSESGRVLVLRLGLDLRPHFYFQDKLVISGDAPLEYKKWYRIVCHLDFQRSSCSLFVYSYCKAKSLILISSSSSSLQAEQSSLALSALTIAGSDSVVLSETGDFHHRENFNGKIASVLLSSHADSIAAVDADSAKNLPGNLISIDFARFLREESSLAFSGDGWRCEAYNCPLGAVTGPHWDGTISDWRLNPNMYNALHFHDSDLSDCKWDTSFQIELPHSLRSGVYSLIVEADDTAPARIPFFVKLSGQTKAPSVALVMPTATYMAYANDHSAFDRAHYEVLKNRLLVLTSQQRFLNEHRELGLSLYDLHSDNSPVCISSRKRPILNVVPKGIAFNFLVDTHFSKWLEINEIDYHVVTDEALHTEGVEAFRGSRVAIFPSHPEYYTREMLQACSDYIESSGRLMYLGGNGFYWKIEFLPGSQESIIELRRGVGGTGNWDSPPGESNSQSSGEPGGLWRFLGKAPQELVGVGMSSLSITDPGYYVRTKESFNERVKFIFDGILGVEYLGETGKPYRAAGVELDRADFELGTPKHALVLASSKGHSSSSILCKEESSTVTPGQCGGIDERVRSDIVFFETESGGAVFSVGSVSWGRFLHLNAYRNDIETVTRNVLRRFLDSRPFEMPD